MSDEIEQPSIATIQAAVERGDYGELPSKIMSQHARNNPDQPPRFADFGGGWFTPQADCFRAAHAAEKTKPKPKPEPQKDYIPGSADDPAHGGW